MLECMSEIDVNALSDDVEALRAILLLINWQGFEEHTSAVSSNNALRDNMLSASKLHGDDTPFVNIHYVEGKRSYTCQFNGPVRRRFSLLTV